MFRRVIGMNSLKIGKENKKRIYSLKELEQSKETFLKAEEYWTQLQREYISQHGTNGSYVGGAGFCVWVKFPRCRKAYLTYIVQPGCPIENVFLSCAPKIEDFLTENGITDTSYVYGILC